MATLYFFITAMLGLGLTTGTLLYFRRRGKLTDNQYALIISVGLSVTWFVSFLAPFLAPESRKPDSELAIFALANSICFGSMGYIMLRVFIAVKRKKK